MYQLTYVVCANQTEAETIATVLLEKRWIACANCLPGMRSFFRWDGKITSAEETVLLLKAPKALQKAIQTEVLRCHSYEVPAILTFEIADGHIPFLDWIGLETSDAETG
ncbi:MAG: divalent-cation tolerance protein CutA [Rickettsiales bacterium]|nr:divalent-cation tolerance protein CutA [Rickettsiales bacterium]|tara:strand:+ start:3021 stop:3347 length:327 start_codon:yes stop_codon:yes gene_type:complete